MTVKEYLASRKGELVEDLRMLVEIDSVRTPALPGMPFGAGGAKALAAAEKLLAAHGYAAANYANYAVEADFGADPSLMLLAHLDVVPVGDGWTKPPFALTEENGLLYGRGATDDKGPAVACIYAMDACRALYGEPKTGVRLVLGSGEETGSEDMEYYFTKRPTLPYTLSPDAEYPLINIEKGRFAPTFAKRTENGGSPRLVSFSGGVTQNIVPGKASAELEGLTAAQVQPVADALAPELKADFEITDLPGGCRVLCAGATAHASLPERGVNAQTALIRLLCALPLAENETAAALSGLASLFPHGETDGASVGLAMQDESGALTLNFGVLSFTDGAFSCGADLRCPVCADGLDLFSIFGAAIGRYGFAVTGGPRSKAHCVPADSPLVRACLSEYEACTGRKGECVAIGGGTYVHEIDGGVAFGVEFPGRDYRIHGADEFADPAELLLTAEMYAGVIRRLCYGGTDEG